MSGELQRTKRMTLEDLARLRDEGQRIALPVPDGFPLFLRRYGPDPQVRTGRVVLLIHGASANGETFLVPHGGLMHFLRRRGWDVWTLDWRGSHDVVDALPDKPNWLEAECPLFNLDRVSEQDIPCALELIRQTLEKEGSGRPNVPIDVVAHCVGSGTFAIALARGLVKCVGNVVLNTLGLFYEAPWDGWVKAEDFLIEKLLGYRPTHRAIDPRRFDQWPQVLQDTYKKWPPSWLPEGKSEADLVFRHLSYMFGQPYIRDRLASGVHGPMIKELFGGMHLGLYLHLGQLVRRGFAAHLDAPDVIDRPRLGERFPGSAPIVRENGYLDVTHFLCHRITLITGAQNRLWHRDSIDLMYEWLRSNGCRREHVVKHVLPNYGHQDLLWGETAPVDVYERILKGISADALVPEPERCVAVMAAQ
jgi:cholesterol oxidase